MKGVIQGAVSQNPHQTSVDYQKPAIAHWNGGREFVVARKPKQQSVDQSRILNSLAVPVEIDHLVDRAVFVASHPDEDRPVWRSRDQVGGEDIHQIRRQARLPETESFVEASVRVQAHQPVEAPAAHLFCRAHEDDPAVALNRKLPAPHGRYGGPEAGVHTTVGKETGELVPVGSVPPGQNLAVRLYGKAPTRLPLTTAMDQGRVAAVRADTADPSVIGQNQIPVRWQRC